MPLRGLSLRIPSPPRSFTFNTLVDLEIIYESMTDSTSLSVCGSNVKVKAPSVTERQSLSSDCGVGRALQIKTVEPFDVPVFTVKSG